MNDYGRLARRQIPTTNIQRKPVEVVNEAPVETHSQPMFIEPVDAPPPPPMVASQVVPPPPADGSRVAIVGGPEGVTIVQQPRRRPQLKGGFGR